MLTLFEVDARASGYNLKQQQVQGLRESIRPSIRKNLATGSKSFVVTPQGCARVS
jgi:hypothetical protein